ncbi:MAG: methylenetetrahydrofolate--tRNA-(uracil(54)-C(5))-methyltransferase (FADH(2)-oxidizing) TrmFO, partial [Nitrospinota bacterium]
MTEGVCIIGGGLAGSEAAWQVAERGVEVWLYEMRPHKMTPAHQTDLLGELVCSNSLKSDQPDTASGLLKEELRRLRSLVIRIAEKARIPAGTALAVDRHQFAQLLTEAIAGHPRIHLVREEVHSLPPDRITIVATGPLTSAPLAAEITRITGRERLYFYDAISPIVEGSSIDFSKTFFASRYGKGEADYVNCPLSRQEYDRFVDALLGAEVVEWHDFEDARYFEGCLPIEEVARRGRDALAFGPFRPVGLRDPYGRRDIYAVVQLRREDMQGEAYNLVGCQTKMTYPEQRRVFRLIPGLEKAVFLRYGSLHRNTYLHAPAVLEKTLRCRQRPNLFFAGQITGVEGYIESVATGLLAGLNAVRLGQGKELLVPPPTTMLGGLLEYITT